RAGLGWDSPAPFAEGSLGDALLEPTRLYPSPVLAAIRQGGVQGLAHITGGGLTENVPRMLPQGLGAEIDLGAWTPPPVFRWLQAEGGLDEPEALLTFNCGIGMVLAAAEDRAEAITSLLESVGETVIRIGQVIRGQGVTYGGRWA
ncbi:MAG TPA: AIR synthase-related protein, partial [Paracoccaceae bacterium]|nr:AIR synthase-related protein [Paracoccaceae bacterium]